MAEFIAAYEISKRTLHTFISEFKMNQPKINRKYTAHIAYTRTTRMHTWTRWNWANQPSKMNSTRTELKKEEMNGGGGGFFDLKLQTIVYVFRCRKQFR